MSEEKLCPKCGGTHYSVDGPDSPCLPPMLMRPPSHRPAGEYGPVSQRAFTNMCRSLFNIDSYLLPELTAEQQGAFIRDPIRYFIGTDKAQQDAIFREVMKRQPA